MTKRGGAGKALFRLSQAGKKGLQRFPPRVLWKKSRYLSENWFKKRGIPYFPNSKHPRYAHIKNFKKREKLVARHKLLRRKQTANMHRKSIKAYVSMLLPKYGVGDN